jgi:hypothetical protein
MQFAWSHLFAVNHSPGGRLIGLNLDYLLEVVFRRFAAENRPWPCPQSIDPMRGWPSSRAWVNALLKSDCIVLAIPIEKGPMSFAPVPWIK